ncbi:MAG: M81 family metallopeptidase [Bacteroidales bacterium]|nr:M81 family metallopeptidase [Bacteroidales bacterium]
MIKRREFIKQSGGMIFTTLGCGITLSSFTGICKVPGSKSSSAAKRIFTARFAHETNTFHPVPTTSWNFQEIGKPDINAWNGAPVEVIPGAGASPDGGGLITEASCREAMNRVLKSLRSAMPVDAVFLRLHGAMFAEGVGHAEAVLTGEVRKMVGPEIPIACTFDLHGNIPSRFGDYADIMVGLKTAPHTDSVQTAELCGQILLDTLEGKVRPVSYVLPIPLLVQGEKAMTTAEPFGSLVEEAKRVEREGISGYKNRILAATLFVGCAWTDAPHTGMSVVITADGSGEAAREAAGFLARKIWDSRYQFDYGCETAELEEGVSRALDAKESTVFLTDSGDNVTASTPGDLPIVLRHLVERRVQSAIVACINDAAAMNKCFEAGEGSRIILSIGATIEKRYGTPLESEVQVIRLVGQPKMAVVKIDAIEVIITDGPSTFRTPAQFERCGIDPLKRKIVVTKMGYLYPELAKISQRHIILMTPGAGDMRIEKLTYTRLRRPIFPLDPETKFEPDKI